MLLVLSSLCWTVPAWAAPPAAEAEWRTLSESFYPRIRGQMVPADMFDEVVRLVTEYRATRPR